MIALLGSQRFSERVRALAAVALGPAVREAERQPRERRLRVGDAGGGWWCGCWEASRAARRAASSPRGPEQYSRRVTSNACAAHNTLMTWRDGV